MTYLLKIYKKPYLIFVDLLSLNFALLFSFYLRLDGSWMYFFNYTYLIIISIIGAVVLLFSNIYNKIWKYASIEELKSIIKVAVLINILFVLCIFFFQLTFPRSILIINGILDLLFLGGLRFVLRIIHDYINLHKNNSTKTRVLIIGAGDAAEMIIREMQKHPELGKEIVGLIDDDPEKSNLEIHGNKVVGNRYQIPDIIKSLNVDEVIIAIPSAKGKEIKELYNLSNQDGVNIKIVPGVFEILNGDVNLTQIRDVKVEDLLRREQVKLNISEISDYLKYKTVLVTGGGGSIGSELCRQVARFYPAQLIIFDNYENNTYFLELELKEKYPDLNIIPVIGSIQDRDKLRYTFSRYQPEVVFHAAAHKHVPLMEHNPEEAVKNNIFGTKNLVEIADEFNVERFVLISTDKAVNPTNVMGATKRVAEMIIQAYNKKSTTKYMAVRFGNVLGSEGSVIPLFKKQIANGGPVTVTHPEVTRYFMTIPEAVQLVIQAGALGKGGEVFVLDMGEPVKIVDLARDLINLSGLKLGEDIEIKITGLRPGEKLFEELLNDEENNLATEHERIFIAKLESVDEKRLQERIKKFEDIVRTGNTSFIIKILKDLVATYKPKRENVIDFTYKKEVASGKE